MPDAGRGDINLHQLIPQYYGESKSRKKFLVLLILERIQKIDLLKKNLNNID